MRSIGKNQSGPRSDARKSKYANQNHVIRIKHYKA